MAAEQVSRVLEHETVRWAIGGGRWFDSSYFVSHEHLPVHDANAWLPSCCLLAHTWGPIEGKLLRILPTRLLLSYHGPNKTLTRCIMCIITVHSLLGITLLAGPSKVHGMEAPFSQYKHLRIAINRPKRSSQQIIIMIAQIALSK